MKEIVKGIFVETQYEGVNVGAIKVEDHLYCIDSPSYPRDARQWSSILRGVHSRPPRYVMLTDCGGDRIMNTRWLDAPLIAHQKGAEQLSSLKRRYPHEWINSLIARSPEGKEIRSGPIEQISISFSEEMSLIADGVTLVARHEPGPTAANSWVYIPERKILFSGDSVVVETHPIVSDLSISQWISSLERMMAMSNVIDLVVPGRGPLGDVDSARPVLDYLLYMQSTVQDHLDTGKARESLSVYVDDFAACFPTGSLPISWIRDQILRGLQRVYDELVVEDYLESPLFKQV